MQWRDSSGEQPTVEVGEKSTEPNHAVFPSETGDQRGVEVEVCSGRQLAGVCSGHGSGLSRWLGIRPGPKGGGVEASKLASVKSLPIKELSTCRA